MTFKKKIFIIICCICLVGLTLFYPLANAASTYEWQDRTSEYQEQFDDVIVPPFDVPPFDVPPFDVPPYMATGQQTFMYNVILSNSTQLLEYDVQFRIIAYNNYWWLDIYYPTISETDFGVQIVGRASGTIYNDLVYRIITINDKFIPLYEHSSINNIVNYYNDMSQANQNIRVCESNTAILVHNHVTHDYYLQIPKTQTIQTGAGTVTSYNTFTQEYLIFTAVAGLKITYLTQEYIIPLIFAFSPIGYQAAYTSGYMQGYNSAYNTAYPTGYKAGYPDGYLTAINGGITSHWFTGLFDGMQGFLNIKFGQISIGAIILIPLSITIVWFIIRQFRGGGGGD